MLRLIPRIFAHSDKNVRAEGTGLALALHSYLGPALDSHLSELKPVQVKELGDAFAAAGAAGEGFPHARQSRFTRKQQRERDVREAENTLSASQGPAAADDGAANGEDGGAPVDESIDPYELADPVNVLDNVPAEFYTHLTSSKWKDRKELALDPLYTLVNTIRLQEGNYDELTRALAGRVASDANVACVTAAANCIECLAKGLRGAFARYRANVMSPLLERLKEKKPSVVESLANALDAVFKATSIKDILEDVPPFAKHKNPAVKAEALKYLVRCLRETTSAPSPVEAKPTVETLCSALEDGAEPVRVAAADALGTLMKVLGGERALGGALDKLDDLRKAKVQEAFEKAEVKIKSGAKARPPPAAAASAPAPSRAAAADAKPKPVSCSGHHAHFSLLTDLSASRSGREWHQQPMPTRRTSLSSRQHRSPAHPRRAEQCQQPKRLHSADSPTRSRQQPRLLLPLLLRSRESPQQELQPPRLEEAARRPSRSSTSTRKKTQRPRPSRSCQLRRSQASQSRTGRRAWLPSRTWRSGSPRTVAQTRSMPRSSYARSPSVPAGKRATSRSVSLRSISSSLC